MGNFATDCFPEDERSEPDDGYDEAAEAGPPDGPWDDRCVPAGMTLLARACWESGFDAHCHEPIGTRVTLDFTREDDLRRFLGAVVRYEPGVDTLYRRAVPGRDKPRDAWSYTMSPTDWGLVRSPGEPESHDGDVRIRFAYRLTLPLADMATVVERVRCYAREVSRANAGGVVG